MGAERSSALVVAEVFASTVWFGGEPSKACLPAEFFIPIRLDKYYSNRKDLQKLGEDVEALVLPKKDLSNFGYEWHEILNRIKEDPYGSLKDYFKRELSETYFGADKERFGRKISQRREDRRETASFATAILHNLFTIRLPPP